MQQLNSTPLLMRDAIKLAKTSDYGRFSLGAIIAQRKRIVSMGTNNRRTHPLQKKYASRPNLNEWRHAEIHAITLAIAGDLVGADVYVARILADGSVANSKPCSGCQRALKDYGLRRMFFHDNGHYFCEDI